MSIASKIITAAKAAAQNTTYSVEDIAAAMTQVMQDAENDWELETIREVMNTVIFVISNDDYNEFYNVSTIIIEAACSIVKNAMLEAPIVTVEAPVIAEVVAEQIEANTEAGMVTIDIVSGATIEATAKQFAIEALARNADAKFLARKYSDRIAKAAGFQMTDEIKLCITKTVSAVVAKFDEALYA